MRGNAGKRGFVNKPNNHALLRRSKPTKLGHKLNGGEVKSPPLFDPRRLKRLLKLVKSVKVAEALRVLPQQPPRVKPEKLANYYV
jgi:hypothetical protein